MAQVTYWVILPGWVSGPYRTFRSAEAALDEFFATGEALPGQAYVQERTRY